MTRARALPVALLAAAVAACGPIPAPPPPLDDNFVPSIAPSFTPDSLAGGDGFTVEEQVAVRLRVSTCDGWATGSGWILNETQIVTNMHVIEGARTIEVTTYDGTDFMAASSAVAPLADLGLVTVSGAFDTFAVTEARQLETGAPVTVVGYPEGDKLTTEQGTYLNSTLDTVGNTGVLVWGLRAQVQPGSSGSPVFDTDGTVVATVFAGDDVGGALAWPIQWFLDAQRDGTWVQNSPAC